MHDSKRSRAKTATTEAPQTLARSSQALALLLSTIAAGAMLLLALQHLAGIALPGCGPMSDCDQAARSAWGRIPGLNWPVSFVGLAYFGALTLVWLLGASVTRTLRDLIRIGGLISLLYAVVIVAERLHCGYCLTAHAANFLLWILIERMKLAPRAATDPPVRIFVATALGITAILGGFEFSARRSASAQAATNAAESTRAIVAASSQRAAQSAPQNADRQPATRATNSEAADAAPTTRGGFTGRYRKGPEKAAIRIVACTDFQCPACKIVDQEIHAIAAERSDVSVSLKHFPMCLDCNKYAGRTMHANACYAARAAEAAGIIKGNDGFWTLHDELFKRSGNFLSKQQLAETIAALKVDVDAFEAVMKSDETLARVRADIEDCMAIGMRYTPMVLINGVEFRGWETPGAIRKAVEQLAATHPEPLTASADVPPRAIERFANEWRKQAPAELPESVRRHTVGPAAAPIAVVMFGDYQEPSVARADAFIRDRVAKNGNISYSFAHFPANSECNPGVPKTIHAQGCWAARIAEGAAKVAGADGFWHVHAWLMAHQTALNDDGLRASASEVGIDIDVLLAAANDSAVRGAIRTDVDLAKRLGVVSLPWIYVNGKPVSVWEYQGESVLSLILEQAETP